MARDGKVSKAELAKLSILSEIQDRLFFMNRRADQALMPLLTLKDYYDAFLPPELHKAYELAAAYMNQGTPDRGMRVIINQQVYFIRAESGRITRKMFASEEPLPIRTTCPFTLRGVLEEYASQVKEWTKRYLVTKHITVKMINDLTPDVAMYMFPWMNILCQSGLANPKAPHRVPYLDPFDRELCGIAAATVTQFGMLKDHEPRADLVWSLQHRDDFFIDFTDPDGGRRTLTLAPS